MRPSISAISFDKFRTKCEALYSTGRHALSTRARVGLVLRELSALGVKSTADLTTDTMARYVTSKGAAANPNTVNGMLGVASSLCSYAVEEGWLSRPPAWRRVRPRSRKMTRNQPARFDQIGALLCLVRSRAEATGRWEDRRFCALVWTMALSALRLREALYLRPEDLDLGASPALAVSPRRRLKTGASAASVPVPDALAEVLRGWLPHAGPDWVFPGVKRVGPWDGGAPGYRPIDWLKRAAAEVGIERTTWHSLRHAYGTYALERWALPVWVVQRVMRHADARTTEGYLHLDGSDRIAESVRGVSYLPAV